MDQKCHVLYGFIAYKKSDPEEILIIINSAV